MLQAHVVLIAGVGVGGEYRRVKLHQDATAKAERRYTTYFHVSRWIFPDEIVLDKGSLSVYLFFVFSRAQPIKHHSSRDVECCGSQDKQCVAWLKMPWKTRCQLKNAYFCGNPVLFCGRESHGSFSPKLFFLNLCLKSTKVVGEVKAYNALTPKTRV